MNGIAPKLPLITTTGDGSYALTKTIKENVMQNFKNLMLTIPGERMMNPNFGCGLYRYLFELDTLDLRQKIASTIRKQTKQYMPFIMIQEINFGDNEVNSGSLSIQIQYFIKPIRQADVLVINSDLN